MLGFSLTTYAQKPQKMPAVPVICPAGPEDMFTKVNVPEVSAHEHQRVMADVQTAEFQITFGPGAQANPEARAAFEYALDIWATQIVSPVPIKIFAEFANLGPGVLASAGPAYNVINPPNAPEADVLYPAALANALAGEVLFPDEDYDLIVNLGNGISWYYGLDGETPAGQFDFVTVALHEAGHGLGFTTVRSFNNGVGSLRSNGNPAVFGLFIENGQGDSLLSFPDPSTQLGDAFTGGDIFMSGDFAVAALLGERPELYAPSSWAGGSSIAHWDEAAFPAGDINSLMTPQVGSAEANFDIGDITRGLFKDMGWVINDADAPLVVVSPTSFDEELFVGTVFSDSVDVSNISDTLVEVTVSAGSSGLVTAITPTTFQILPGEAENFNFTLETAGFAKGNYADTLNLVINGSGNVNVVLAITVLDGTEAPIIAINPSEFSKSIDQFQVETEALTITNEGDAPLTYNLSVNGDTLDAFTENVLKTNAAIAAKGFSKETFSRTQEGSSLTAAVISRDRTFNRLITDLYSTGFETFELGELDGQLGWGTLSEGRWSISSMNAFEDSQHLRGTSDGSGETAAAFSPGVSPADEPFMVASALINIQGSGTTFQFTPQSPTEQLVNTRIQFNPDGTVEALTSNGFVQILDNTPTGYFELKVIVDKDDATFAVFIDDELVFSGEGGASIIEEVVLISSMETAGSTFDVDNLQITDGDPNAFFLTVAPSAGTVPIGGEAIVNVKFDARVLDPGSYTASLELNSNDEVNSPISVPVSLTVLQPPTIEVTPDSLSAAVDVTVDDPATRTATITVSNSGESDLEFDAAPGAINFSPPSDASAIRIASLDMARYGKGNNGSFEEKLAGSLSRIEQITGKMPSQLENASFTDSISYDTGLTFPDDFAGVDTAPYTAAIKFDVESNFTLTAVRNAYRTEAVADPSIILEIYKGGDTPNDGELLLAQVFDQASSEGIVVAEILEEALSFSAGESFWVVHKYPDGISFPQGVDDDATQRANTYFFSSDGGATFNSSGFVFFVRALSGGTEGGYITLEPASGTVAPNQSLDIQVTFDGTELANGTYNTDINISSNDPINASESVATTFEVSGQQAEVSISDEFLLFDNVFIGNAKQRSFNLLNTGLANLNVSDISVDNEDYSLSVSSANIGAGDSLVVSVTFEPSSTGNINGIITVITDASTNGTLEVVVNGVGVEPPLVELSPSFKEETTDAGTVLESSLTLINDGNAPLIFSFPDLTVNTLLANENVKLNDTEIRSFSAAVTPNEKGAKDGRVGAEVLYSVGTDNGFGYTWIDSDEAGGPIYNFSDITASGEEITTILGGDGSTLVNLPFEFEFYGQVNNTAYINANGYLAFDEPSGNTYTNTQIPTDDANNNLIAGFWDDLEPQNFNGAVHYEAFTDKFIVQWTQAAVFFGSADETVTFQIVLHANGDIDVFYDDVETASFNENGTVGIENADGSDGAQVAFNTSYIKDNLALRFVKPSISLTPFISDVSPLSGVVAAGSSKALTVSLDATELNDGVYFDELAVSSNAPVDTASTTLFELTVIGFPEIEVEPDTIIFDSLFVGLSTQASILISNVGSKTLEISEISNMTGSFAIDSAGPITLLPDATFLLDVEFAPEFVGVLEDIINIKSNDVFGNQTTEVYVRGVGVDPPIIGVTPDSLAVSVYVGDSTTENITIENLGVADLTFSLSPPFFAAAGNVNATVLGYEQLSFEKIWSKETADLREGPKFLNASGGPGTFGYTFIDNNSNGPAYDFIDIAETGTLANVGADGDETVALPFDFNFFGNSENSVTIGANGFLTFGSIIGTNFVNQQIPNSANPNLIIAPFWNDIEPQNGGGVYYQSSSDHFIVQYDSVPGFGFPPFFPIPAAVTFQVILFPDGQIKMQYEDVEGSTQTTSATVGLEGAQGVTGLQVVFNNTYLEDGLAITFTPPVLGTVASGSSVDVPVTFSSEGLNPNEIYEGNIAVSSNDPITPLVEVPVSLEVLPVPEVLSFTLVDASINEAIGSLQDGDIINLDNYPSNSFSIVANVGDEMPESVVFDFNDVLGYQTENVVPYALNGDSNGGDNYNGVALEKGINNVKATPYTKRNGNGKAGISLEVAFEVIDNGSSLCYGQSVQEYAPGARKNGSTLPSSRTVASKALGAPQENDAYNFVSLGFGGSIEIALACEVMDHEGNDLLIVETSFRDLYQPCASYPEKAKVEASEDGENWVVIAEEICKDGEVDLANGGLSFANYIRITDVSDAADFAGGNADGYDLDAIVVINKTDSSNQMQVVDNIISEDNIVANEEDISIRAYPNPATDVVSFSLTGKGDTFLVQLYDISGNNVYNQELNFSDGATEGEIPVASLAQGLYNLRLTDSNGGIVSQFKIMKR